MSLPTHGDVAAHVGVLLVKATCPTSSLMWACQHTGMLLPTLAYSLWRLRVLPPVWCEPADTRGCCCPRWRTPCEGYVSYLQFDVSLPTHGDVAAHVGVLLVKATCPTSSLMWACRHTGMLLPTLAYSLWRLRVLPPIWCEPADTRGCCCPRWRTPCEGYVSYLQFDVSLPTHGDVAAHVGVLLVKATCLTSSLMWACRHTGMLLPTLAYSLWRLRVLPPVWCEPADTRGCCCPRWRTPCEGYMSYLQFDVSLPTHRDVAAHVGVLLVKATCPTSSLMWACQHTGMLLPTLAYSLWRLRVLPPVWCEPADTRGCCCPRWRTPCEGYVSYLQFDVSLPTHGDVAAHVGVLLVKATCPTSSLMWACRHTGMLLPTLAYSLWRLRVLPPVWCEPADTRGCCCPRWRTPCGAAGSCSARWGSPAATSGCRCSWESGAESAFARWKREPVNWEQKARVVRTRQCHQGPLPREQGDIRWPMLSTE